MPDIVAERSLADQNGLSYTVTVVKNYDEETWDWRIIAVAVLMLLSWSTGFYLAENLREASRCSHNVTRSTQTGPPEKEEMLTQTLENLRSQCRTFGLGTSGVKEEIAERLVRFRIRANDIADLHRAGYE